MKKPKIYLDTSVINFLFADDTPDFKKVTIDFFENYFSEYEVYISDVVLLEINIHKETLINAINEKEGYWKKLHLMSPLEALYED